MLTAERKSDAATATLGIGAAVIAIACCAGVLALAGLPGALTLGGVLGFGSKPSASARASARGVRDQRR